MNIAERRKKELTNVSLFVGEVTRKSTGKTAYCDWCKTELAMWQHTDKNGKPVLLCFGCGDH